MTYPLPLWTVACVFTVVIQEILIGIASEFSWQVDAGFEAVTVVGTSCALIDVKTGAFDAFVSIFARWLTRAGNWGAFKLCLQVFVQQKE